MLALFAILAGGVAGMTCSSDRPIRPFLFTTLGMAVLGLGLVVFKASSAIPEEGVVTPPEPDALISIGMIFLVAGLALSVALAVGRLMRGRTSWVSASILGGLGSIAVIVGLFVATL